MYVYADVDADVDGIWCIWCVWCIWCIWYGNGNGIAARRYDEVLNKNGEIRNKFEVCRDGDGDGDMVYIHTSGLLTCLPDKLTTLEKELKKFTRR